MSAQQEINRGYVDYLRELDPDPAARPSASRPATPPPKNSLASEWLLSLAKTSPRLWKSLVLILLISTSVAILALVRVMSLFRPLEPNGMHDRALKHVDQFLEQYPFYLYGVVCKSLELAYFETELPKVLSPGDKVAELAIGDGTLSERVYSPGTKLTALDISPYSLRNPAAMPHVKQAAVSDCVNPALRSGSFDLLVTNNFLHHVTDKGAVLDHIARISRRSIFNDNTTYWASAWPGPFLLGRLGFKSRAKQRADAIEKYYLQCLLPKPALDALVSDRFNVISSQAYVSELTNFFCTVFSRIMSCYGPPMPPPLKAMLLERPLIRRIAFSLTRRLSRALIRFDSHQDISRAVIVSYACESKTFRATPGASDFICPDCETTLPEDLHCASCGRQFPSKDGMAFILPRELEFIHTHYSGQAVYHPGVAKQHH